MALLRITQFHVPIDIDRALMSYVNYTTQTGNLSKLCEIPWVKKQTKRKIVFDEKS